MALEHLGHRNKGPNFQVKLTQNHPLLSVRLWGFQGRSNALTFPRVVLPGNTMCMVLLLICPGFNSSSKAGFEPRKLTFTLLCFCKMLRCLVQLTCITSSPQFLNTEINCKLCIVRTSENPCFLSCIKMYQPLI